MDYSIVIPVFNEGKRLSVFFPELIKKIQQTRFIVELIIVDDGSSQDDHQIYCRLIELFPYPHIRLLTHRQNHGKGAAILTGLKEAQGVWIGFIDGDGATSADEVVRIFNFISQAPSVFDGIFGSRIKMLGYPIKRSALRHYCGRIFVTFVDLLLKIASYDPQCGTKFFKRERILSILSQCQEQGYLLDIELISLGIRNHLNFMEYPICWEDVSGSKVSIFNDSFKMAMGILRIKRRVNMLYPVPRRLSLF